MLKDPIQIELYPNELRYKPGGPPATFDVTVVNHSDRFATFQIELEAPVSEAKHRWYELYPEVSSKQPPGDTTRFTVKIIDNPKPGFVDLMTLKVWVYILELQQKDWQSLPLILEKGTGFVPLKVELLVRSLQAQPSELVEIPIQIGNLGQVPVEAIARCTGIEPAWFLDGPEQRIRIEPGEDASARFLCRIPEPTRAPSQVYPLVIEASQSGGSVDKAEGALYVTPAGTIDFRCSPLQQRIPKNHWLPNWKTQVATYTVQVDNQSNLPQQVAIAVKPDEDQPKCQIQVVPELADLDINQTAQLDLTIHKRRRWFGWPQKFLFEVKPELSDPRVEVRNDAQLLKLLLHPVLPRWLQALIFLAIPFLFWWFSCLNPNNELSVFGRKECGHRKAINSVKFNGVGDKLISGSDDQSIINWMVSGFFSPLIDQNLGAIGKTGKSVGVVRYRPVNNDLVAVGLENGETQLWSTIAPSKLPLATFMREPGDRVFDLAFTQDSQRLYSGHGSGRVVEWNLDPAGTASAGQPVQTREQRADFAVYALSLVGPAGSHLAIAGRFNQLVFWDLGASGKPALSRDKYGRPGSDQNYIRSLSSPSQKPYRLASADDQGTIRLWDLRSCLTSRANCQLLDQWTPDTAIHSVAFTADGCYLSSAGASGQAMLWSLKSDGRRVDPDSAGTLVERSPKPLNAIDAIRVDDAILVTTGGDETQITVYRINPPSSDCQ